MKKLLPSILWASIILVGCQQKSGKSTTIGASTDSLASKSNKLQSTKKQLIHEDFLTSLGAICVEDNGVYKNCDELFSKDGASLFFLLIPKAGAKNWFEAESKYLSGAVYEKNNALTTKIQNIDKSELSKEFEVWVFYTDKKYTQHVGMDAAYNVKNPHVTNLYYLKSGKSNWEMIESFKAKTDSDVQKELKWKDDFINKATALSNKKSNKSADLTGKVSTEWNGKYSTYFSYGEIAGQNAGWLLEIDINSNKITATGEGYQISFLDELSAEEKDNELILNNLKNISGYKKGATMRPEFVIIRESRRFYVKSKWIDDDIITKPKASGYEISRTGM